MHSLDSMAFSKTEYMVKLTRTFFPKKGQWISPDPTGLEQVASSGPGLSDWSLAINLKTDDLVFLNTAGYNSGYFKVHGAPGGALFLLKDWMIQSRDSNESFNVLYADIYHPGDPNSTCTRENLVEFARRWNGFELIGDDRRYYLTLIKSIVQREEKEEQDRWRAEEEEKQRQLRELERKFPDGVTWSALAADQEKEEDEQMASMRQNEEDFPSRGHDDSYAGYFNQNDDDDADSDDDDDDR